MKKGVYQLFVALSPVIFFTACDGLGKMLKKQKEIQYSVSPNPLEMVGDTVQFSANGKFNPKLFAKKVTLTITPVLKFSSGGEKSLKTITLVGEKATGEGQKISYSNGGSFSYTSEKIPFEESMRNATLELRAVGQVKKKSKNFDPVKLADGTLATSLLVRHDEKPLFGKDNFQKSYPANQTTHIYYVINQSVVRPSEMKSDEMKAFLSFVNANISSQWYQFKGIEVSAFASPDGETDRNENLAKDRAKTGSEAVMKEFQKNKDKNITFGKTKDQYKVVLTREDWEGFKQLMEQSTIADKDLILRVLSMYSDPNQRRKEIKNLSKTYQELAEKVLPKLRRAEIVLLADKVSRNDDQILALLKSTPDSLSLEEILYGANLLTDLNEKANAYKHAQSRFGNDWRTSNNLGAVYILQNKMSEAEEAIKKAASIAPNEPAVLNNLGIIEARKENRVAAMEYYKKAGSAPETKYNMGIINVRFGKYADAVSNFGEFKGHNKALAQLLSGNAGAVKETIDASNEKDMAHAYYLKAIAAARSGNSQDVISNLKAAIEKDSKWKSYAKDDCEFLKFRNDSGFTSLLN